MCEQLLANPLIESYEIVIDRADERAAPDRRRRRLPRLERRPATPPGRSARSARTRSSSGTATRSSLPDTGAVVLPGGFSYGDYLRCGAIARFSPVMRAVAAFAADGGPVLGICNGFQILCEAGLLPGVLRPNASLSFVCRDVAVRVERVAPPFTSRCEQGQRLVIPVKHGEGCWFAPPELVEELEHAGPDRPPLRRGREPERLDRRRRGRLQRARAT